MIFQNFTEYSTQQDSGVMSGNGPPEVGVEPPFVSLGIIKDEIANISINATAPRELPTVRILFHTMNPCYSNFT